MNKKLLIVLLPVVALICWVASLEYEIATSHKIRIRVEGYDPRDLLAGHYINFSLTTGDKSPCRDAKSSNSVTAYCLCYAPADDGIYHEPTWGGSCDEKPQNCGIFVRGLCEWDRFTVNADRYSFPEYYASALQTLPPDSSAQVSVSARGSMKVLKLYSGELTVEEYANKKIQEDSERILAESQKKLQELYDTPEPSM